MARAKKAARGNRKSIQINNEREKRRMKRQLQRQDPKLNVTSEMIQSMSEQRGMGIIQSAVQINRPRNNYYASRNSPSAGNLKEKQTAFVRDIKNKLATIPYKPSKKNVCWLSDKQQQQDTDLSLTEELLQFAEFVAPDAGETAARMNVVNDISECILVKYPQAVVSQFGSFPAGLATFLSDIDLSILNMGIDGEDDVALRSYRKRGAGQNFYQREKLSAEKVSDQPDDQHQSQVSPHASTDAVEDMEEQNNGSVLDLHGGFSDDQGTSGTNISWVIDKTGDSQHNVEKDMSSTEQMLEATVEEEVSAVRWDPFPEQKLKRGTSIGSGSTKSQKLVIDDCFDDDGSESGSENANINGNGDSFLVDDGSSIGDTSSSDDDLILARGKSTDKSFDKDNASSSILRKRTALEADLDVSFIDHNSDQSNIRVTSMSNSSLDTKAMQLVSINRPRNSLNSTKRCTSGDQEEGEIIEEVDNSFIVDLTELEDTQDQDNSVTGKQRRMLLINYLKGLYDHMKSMWWVHQLEFRKKAKVPILNIIHKNGIECDVSIGMSAQDTTAIVQSLKEKCRHALQILSSFLKVYLYQLGLDKPFTGGLGSFKLYVMIAHIVWKNFHYVQETRPNYGMLLLLFLQYFGQEKNLCKETCLTVGKAEVTFEGTLQIIYIRLAFQKAYQTIFLGCKRRSILLQACIDRSAGKSASRRDEKSTVYLALAIHNTRSQRKSELASNSLGMNAGELVVESVQIKQQDSMVIETEKLRTEPLRSHNSHSLLAPVLDTVALFSKRLESGKQCHSDPLLSSQDRDRIAEGVLSSIRSNNQRAIALPSLEEIKELNPLLASRLRSFRSVDAFLNKASTNYSINNSTSSYDLARITSLNYQRCSLYSENFTTSTADCAVGTGSATEGAAKQQIMTTNVEISAQTQISDSLKDISSISTAAQLPLKNSSSFLPANVNCEVDPLEKIPESPVAQQNCVPQRYNLYSQLWANPDNALESLRLFCNKYHFQLQKAVHLKSFATVRKQIHLSSKTPDNLSQATEKVVRDFLLLVHSDYRRLTENLKLEGSGSQIEINLRSEEVLRNYILQESTDLSARVANVLFQYSAFLDKKTPKTGSSTTSDVDASFDFQGIDLNEAPDDSLLKEAQNLDHVPVHKKVIFTQEVLKELDPIYALVTLNVMKGSGRKKLEKTVRAQALANPVFKEILQDKIYKTYGGKARSTLRSATKITDVIDNNSELSDAEVGQRTSLKTEHLNGAEKEELDTLIRNYLLQVDPLYRALTISLDLDKSRADYYSNKIYERKVRMRLCHASRGKYFAIIGRNFCQEVLRRKLLDSSTSAPIDIYADVDMTEVERPELDTATLHWYRRRLSSTPQGEKNALDGFVRYCLLTIDETYTAKTKNLRLTGKKKNKIVKLSKAVEMAARKMALDNPVVREQVNKRIYHQFKYKFRSIGDPPSKLDLKLSNREEIDGDSVFDDSNSDEENSSVSGQSQDSCVMDYHRKRKNRNGKSANQSQSNDSLSEKGSSDNVAESVATVSDNKSILVEGSKTNEEIRKFTYEDIGRIKIDQRTLRRLLLEHDPIYRQKTESLLLRGKSPEVEENKKKELGARISALERKKSKDRLAQLHADDVAYLSKADLKNLQDNNGTAEDHERISRRTRSALKSQESAKFDRKVGTVASDNNHHDARAGRKISSELKIVVDTAISRNSGLIKKPRESFNAVAFGSNANMKTNESVIDLTLVDDSPAHISSNSYSSLESRDRSISNPLPRGISAKIKCSGSSQIDSQSLVPNKVLAINTIEDSTITPTASSTPSAVSIGTADSTESTTEAILRIQAKLKDLKGKQLLRQNQLMSHNTHVGRSIPTPTPTKKFTTVLNNKYINPETLAAHRPYKNMVFYGDCINSNTHAPDLGTCKRISDNDNSNGSSRDAMTETILAESVKKVSANIQELKKQLEILQGAKARQGNTEKFQQPRESLNR